MLHAVEGARKVPDDPVRHQTLHGGDSRHVVLHIVNARQADVRRHVLPVQQHTLHAVGVVIHADVYLRQQRQHRRCVLGVHAAALHIQPDGTVDGTGVHIQDAQTLRHRLGQCALPCAGGPVNGHGVSFLTHLYYPHFSAAKSPARCPVAHAI